MFWKNHSLSMEYFLQKCSWQQFLKSSSFCEYCSMLKVKKKELNEPFLLTKTRKTEIMEFLFLKCFWKFMDTISHSDPSSHRKFYMHQENNVPFMTKKMQIDTFGTLWKNTDISPATPAQARYYASSIIDSTIWKIKTNLEKMCILSCINKKTLESFMWFMEKGFMNVHFKGAKKFYTLFECGQYFLQYQFI